MNLFVMPITGAVRRTQDSALPLSIGPRPRRSQPDPEGQALGGGFMKSRMPSPAWLLSGYDLGDSRLRAISFQSLFDLAVMDG
ncbi:hypothetical protein OH146_09420 [Salinibacterium sp. SYSU T00001]|uniref:hypothetical protein n=1 Tax=Homoserinimonas sedimenticola TaxID=2986805 RepID=UPI0022369D4E|nr:hypothetical protein [Salinibacterium sedimenticola]MCW4385989.1 hypothetical protein [Salinibacterium sedimenticola]